MDLTELACRTGISATARPLRRAAMLGTLLTAWFALVGQALTFGKVLVALACAGALLFAVFLVPAGGKAPMTLDGCAAFRRVKNSQLSVAVFVAYLLAMVLSPPAAGACGLVAALAVRARTGVSAESQGD